MSRKKAPASAEEKRRATCATTAGYVYQAWPKGKPIRKIAAKRKPKRAG